MPHVAGVDVPTVRFSLSRTLMFHKRHPGIGRERHESCFLSFMFHMGRIFLGLDLKCLSRFQPLPDKKSRSGIRRATCLTASDPTLVMSSLLYDRPSQCLSLFVSKSGMQLVYRLDRLSSQSGDARKSRTGQLPKDRSNRAASGEWLQGDGCEGAGASERLQVIGCEGAATDDWPPCSSQSAIAGTSGGSGTIFSAKPRKRCPGIHGKRLGRSVGIWGRRVKAV